MKRLILATMAAALMCAFAEEKAETPAFTVQGYIGVNFNF